MALYITAYVIPAAAVWGLLSAMFRLLGNILLVMPLLAVIYAFGFGMIETLGSPLQAPGLTWQVPAHWIKERPVAVQTLTWGTLLGPGLLTRNPYAGIWLLPLLSALSYNLLTALGVGVAIGIAHGGASAIGILSNRKRMNVNCMHILMLGGQRRWKYIDGLALLLATGGLVAYIL